jgi:hypothetical protein
VGGRVHPAREHHQDGTGVAVVPALAEQRAQAEADLTAKERAYEQFRVRTIDQPSEALAIQPGAPGAGSATVIADPALSNYQSNKYALEAVKRQREQLQRVGVRAGSDSVPTTALLNVDVVNSDPVAAGLKQSLADLQTLDTQIRQDRRIYQDSTLPLKPKLVQRRQLAALVIPRQTNEVINQLQVRERQLSGAVSQGSGELRAIPGRTTQLEALRRDRDAAALLFTNLNQRFAEVQLAERSMTPDVRVLDRAVMPSVPTENTLPTLLVGGLVAGTRPGARPVDPARPAGPPLPLPRAGDARAQAAGVGRGARGRPVAPPDARAGGAGRGGVPLAAHERALRVHAQHAGDPDGHEPGGERRQVAHRLQSGAVVRRGGMAHGARGRGPAPRAAEHHVRLASGPGSWSTSRARVCSAK